MKRFLLTLGLLFGMVSIVNAACLTEVTSVNRPYYSASGACDGDGFWKCAGVAKFHSNNRIKIVEPPEARASWVGGAIAPVRLMQACITQNEDGT